MAGTIEANSARTDSGSEDFCCLEHAVLECIGAPVVVHDADIILYANASARAFFDGALPAETPIDGLVSPEFDKASAERRRFMLDSGSLVGDVTLDVSPKPGTTHTISSRGIRIAYADGKHALVQLIVAVDGKTTTAYEIGPLDPPEDSTSFCHDCIHQAAYDVLPFPTTVIDKTTIRRTSRGFRRLVAATGPMRDVPTEMVVHPDFLQAAQQRRHLVIDLGAPVTGASVKLRALDAVDVYLMIDACHVEYRGSQYMVTLGLHSKRV